MRPFSLLIKPSGPDCNIACQYCFYCRKAELFDSAKHRMRDEMLERLVSDYMRLGFEMSSFAWQGGEPTLIGLDFYKRVVELQQAFCKDGQHFSNALQTNAILLDDNWCRFLAEHNFLVGISLDGTKEMHDHYRLDKGGNDTFDRVVKAINCCKEFNVDYNILTLLNDHNVGRVDEVFDFFIEQNFKFWQFVPCVEIDPDSGEVAGFSITPKQFGDFLCRLFDRWIQLGPEKISIRMFDSILSYCLNGRHTNCTFNRSCNDYLVVEHNGDVFCCDFFVEPDFKCGNIMDQSLGKLIASDVKKEFARRKSKVENKCFLCRHKAICQGGCLKDRIVDTSDYAHCSYFCESYRQFFDYALPKFMQIAAEFSSRGL